LPELPSADDALALAARAGIHRLPIPTPFLVGRVNCYLIEDDPLTLVDTGPNSGKSLDELERALAAHDHSIEDLELIVITHQHLDHVGLLDVCHADRGPRWRPWSSSPSTSSASPTTPRRTTSSPRH
jgi:glyoxylase-like metal-dependent hydrolase (beta-lactamase superfamily II)